MSKKSIVEASDKLRELADLYVGAPEEMLTDMISTGEKYGLDPLTVQFTVYRKDDGQWRYKISKHGYRKIAMSDPSYVSHVCHVLYKNDEVAIDEYGRMRIIYRNKGRLHQDIVRGIGCLKRTDNTGKVVEIYAELSFGDYSGYGNSWAPITGSPDGMFQKELECHLIRTAFCHLFWDSAPRSYLVADIANEDEVAVDTRQSLLAYLRKNQAHVTKACGTLQMGFNKMGDNELLKLVETVKEYKEKEGIND